MRITIARVSSMPLGDIWHGLKTAFADAHMRIAPVPVLAAQMDARTQLGGGPDLVVLPGINGEKSPYPGLFGAAERDSLRNYIANGGKVLGVCAGAYFLSEMALYDFGSQNRYDRRDSMRGVFHGAAAGPLRAGENDQYIQAEGHQSGEIWTVATHYPVTDTLLHSPYGRGPALYPHFDNAQNVQVLARYVDQPRQPAAALSADVGQGRVVLTGVLPYMQKNCDAHRAAWDSLVEPLRQQTMRQPVAAVA